MIRICTIVVAGSLAMPCFGQTAQTVANASISNGDRMTLVRTSIDVPAWHEKNFWPLYENYVGASSNVSSDVYRALQNLATADRNMPAEEAADMGQQLLSLRGQELQLLKSFYIEIGKEFNGLIALQFLQTEAMLDMVESASIYDDSQWKKFRFHPKALRDDQVTFAKRNVITKAMMLKAEETDNFWSVYAEYEEERDAVLGNDYDMVSVFAGDVVDFTPALAKRLGYDLLTLMEREQKLKEKYFQKMVDTAGPVVGARFLAWEDYYSLISKMNAWSEAE
jgi:hypothetical protein